MIFLAAAVSIVFDCGHTYEWSEWSGVEMLGVSVLLMMVVVPRAWCLVFQVCETLVRRKIQQASMSYE